MYDSMVWYVFHVRLGRNFVSGLRTKNLFKETVFFCIRSSIDCVICV